MMVIREEGVISPSLVVDLLQAIMVRQQNERTRYGSSGEEYTALAQSIPMQTKSIGFTLLEASEWDWGE